MANMKMIALMDAEISRARAISAAEITALAITTAQALAELDKKCEQLRRDVDELKKREDGVP